MAKIDINKLLGGGTAPTAPGGAGFSFNPSGLNAGRGGAFNVGNVGGLTAPGAAPNAGLSSVSGGTTRTVDPSRLISPFVQGVPLINQKDAAAAADSASPAPVVDVVNQPFRTAPDLAIPTGRPQNIDEQGNIVPDKPVPAVPTSTRDLSGQLSTFADIQSALNNQSGLLQTFLADQTKLAAEREAAIEQTQQFDTQTTRGLQGLEDQAIPTPIIGKQQELLRRQRVEERDSVVRRLEAAQRAEATGFERAKFALGLGQQNIENILGISEVFRGIAKEDKEEARQDILDILAFAEGQSFEELDPATQQSLAASLEGTNLTLGAVQQALARNKTAMIAEQQQTAIQSMAARVGIQLDQAQINKIHGELSKVNERALNIARGTPEALRNIIAELPVGQQEGAFATIQAFKNADDMIKLLDQGVNTGPLAGRALKGLSVFGLPLTPSRQTFSGILPGIGSGEGANTLLAQTVAFTANYIKAISGAQVSDKEREFLEDSLPDVTMQEDVIRDRLKSLMGFIKNKYELQLGIKFSDFPGTIPDIGEDEIEADFNLFIQ